MDGNLWNFKRERERGSQLMLAPLPRLPLLMWSLILLFYKAFQFPSWIFRCPLSGAFLRPYRRSYTGLDWMHVPRWWQSGHSLKLLSEFLPQIWLDSLDLSSFSTKTMDLKYQVISSSSLWNSCVFNVEWASLS